MKIRESSMCVSTLISAYKEESQKTSEPSSPSDVQDQLFQKIVFATDELFKVRTMSCLNDVQVTKVVSIEGEDVTTYDSTNPSFR